MDNINSFDNSQQLFILSKVIPKISETNLDKALELADKISDKILFQKTLYNIAKNVINKDNKKAIEIVNELEEKYLFGFNAYENAINKNEQAIDHDIDIFTKYISSDSIKSKDVNALLEIGLSIADYYPYKAKNILETINDTYEKVGSQPGETVDLSVKIVQSIANIDIIEALKYLDIIEVDYYRTEVFIDIVSKLTDSKMIDKATEMIF